MCLLLSSGFWLPSRHSTIKAWLVECCRDGCPSGRFSHHHTGTLELWQSEHWVRGLFPDQGPSPQLLSLALGRVLVVPNYFHLRIIETTVFLETFNAIDMFWYPSPDLCLNTILSRSSMDNSFDLMVWFLLWHALSTVGHYTDRCVPIQTCPVEFATGGLQSCCRNISRMINGNRMHLNSISRFWRHFRSQLVDLFTCCWAVSC
jgi:hypothetical protein